MPTMDKETPNDSAKSLSRRARRSRACRLTQIASFESTELSWCNKARVKLLQDLDNNQDPLIRVKIVAALDTLSERKRIILGIPMPGARKPSDKPTVSVPSADPIDVYAGPNTTQLA